MKVLQFRPDSHPPPRTVRWALGALLLALRLALPSTSPAAILAPAREDDLFRSTNLLHISVAIPEEGMQMLRRAQGKRNQPKPQAQATVTEGDRTYTNVTVQLKGFTTFQPIDRRASFTLSFDKHAPKQRFHGLAKISLNNSLQDRTRLHEKFARELFAAAGVPVPRADHAVVTLNGRRLGLYVLTEGYNKDFLKRHFPDATGNLYEGGVLQDIDRPLRLNSGRSSGPDPALDKLIQAAQEPNPDRRLSALREALDLDRFLSMVAMETILCHSDSYSMNRNNYRLYHDPVSDKMVFLPHGMDRILGTHRSSLDLAIVPPTLGMVARSLLSTTEGRRLLIERVELFVTNLFQPEQLCRRVHEIDAKIAGQRPDRPTDPGGQSHAQDAEDLCRRIALRAADLRVQIAHSAPLLKPAPTPAFDAAGRAHLEVWLPRPKSGQPEVHVERAAQTLPLVWQLHSRQGSLVTSFRSRFQLPPGRYRLVGKVEAKSATAATALAASFLRHSSARFDEDRTSINPNGIDFRFQVANGRWPEEFEFICDLADPSPDVRVDVRGLQLVRERD